MSEYNAGTYFDEGFKARYGGKHRADNPYTIRSMQGHEWMSGWTEADNKIYEDAKYVREGAAMAYLAALKAIDGWLLGKGTQYEKLPKSIAEYWEVRRKIPHNGKFTEDLTIAYQNLHLGACYQGFVDIEFVKNGLQAVKEIISMLEK